MVELLLDFPALGYGDVICLQPAIDLMQRRGWSVAVRANNPGLESLLKILGARWVPFWYEPQKELYLRVQGIACEFERRPDVNGNRAKAYLMAVGANGDALNVSPRLDRSQLPSINQPTPDGIFIQLYAAEPYKQMSDSWYRRFVKLATLRGIKLWSIVQPGILDEMRSKYPEVRVLSGGHDVTKALSLFSGAEAAFVLCSMWLQAAGSLGVPGIAALGPTASPGRIVGYPTVISAPNPCEYCPCWRVSNVVCKLTGGLVSKCLEDLNPANMLDLLLEQVNRWRPV